MRNNTELIAKVAQIIAYILGVIIIIQLLKSIFGGTWAIEDVILALVILNLTVTFGMVGYLISLSNKITGHIEWHKGRDQHEDK